jgi:NADH-quinone oxidoreductase subunit B
LKGIDRYIPVDVHIPGCPPRPEALMDAFITLQKKIDAQSLTGTDRPRYLNPDEPSEFVVPEYGAHDLEPPKNVKLWNIISKPSASGPRATGDDGSGKD